MSLFNARYEAAARDLASSEDEVLQSAGMMALMRLETLQRRVKGLNAPFNKRALTPLPYMYPNPPNVLPTPWWQQTGFSFGSNPQQTSFGAPQSSLFGASNQTAAFGASQSTGFGSNQTAAFGASQPTGLGANQSTGFGASQSTGFGVNQSTTFSSNPSTGFGSSQPVFGACPLQSQNTSSTSGSTTSLFGAPTPAFGTPAQSAPNPSGNTSFSFGIPVKDPSDKNEEVTAISEPAVFNTSTSVVPSSFGSDKS